MNIEKMSKTFILIHGGSHGGWCWEDLQMELVLLGHKAYYFDLPGHGRDETPRSDIKVENYVKAIDNYVSLMGKENVIIVAHSLAGVYVPQAIVKSPDNYAQVIYLAGIITERGERAIDFIPEERRPSYYELTHQSGDGTFMLPFEVAYHNFFHDLPQQEARDFYRKMTPQPLNIYLEQQTVSPKEIKCKKDYIICTKDRALPMELTMVFGVKADAQLHMLDSSHDAMLTKTKFLAAMLDDLS
jgi:pimeloyl-ACP methyl ester carboxylesterase